MIASPYPKSTRWLIVVPALFLLVFLAIPTAVIVVRGASADAFLTIITSRSFRRVAWFTLWQTILSTVLTVACALPVTFILSRFSFTGKRLLLACSHYRAVPLAHSRCRNSHVCVASRTDALHRSGHHYCSRLFQYGSSGSFSHASMVTN